MKKAIVYKKTEPEPLTDVVIPRCPDIRSFHFSLDRVFGDRYEYCGETHPFYEIVYVLSGSLGVTAGEKVYILDAGKCLIHPPNEFHRIWSERGTEPHVLNLSFHASDVPTGEGRIFEPGEEQREEFLSICLDVREGLHSENLPLLNEQRLRLEQWLIHAVETVSERGLTESSGALRYAEIVGVLQEHLSEPLDTNQIALLCRMSLSNLKKVFSKYAGMGISRFFTEMKIRHAAELLRQGKRVGEVAQELGFVDQNYFSTVFRRIMGVPPGRYRDS